MKPKIYVFFNSQADRDGDGVYLALAEDGTVLGSHWSSDGYWAQQDLGVAAGSRPDRHVTYAEHYPGGYEMEFVPASEVKRHPGLTSALELAETRREPPPSAKLQMFRAEVTVGESQ